MSGNIWMYSHQMLTINALVAADSVLIPVQAAYLPVKGLQQLIRTISTVRRRMNRNLKIEGICLNIRRCSFKWLVKSGHYQYRITRSLQNS